MSIEIVIDTRERFLIEKLEENSIQFTVEQLELGDVLFRQNNEIVLIIERKTVTDLKESICDGRAREQKARLLGNFSSYRIIYLVEGSLDKKLSDKISGFPVSTLIGSMINTQLRDGIKVYKTSSINESTQFLIKLLDKLTNDGDKYFRNEEQKISQSQYATSLKKAKKANMTPSLWFLNQLLSIPQVAENIAQTIVANYSSVKDLLNAYQDTPEILREKLLADLTYPLKTGKTRRIGNVISKRVYHFFYGIEESATSPQE